MNEKLKIRMNGETGDKWGWLEKPEVTNAAAVAV